MIYSTFTAYSPIFDCETTRLSMVNERGEEFWCMLPNRTEGRAWRALKKEAVEVLTEAIKSGLEAGEIRWRTNVAS